ncbi:MAG TPA: glycosyl hydrolase family 18 protein, partial [Acidimicrobiales bacterium]|nr:glycosyl hydrolase family 18 protein [Acidimicrobiales bacterium]
MAGTFFLFMLCGGFLLGSGGTTLTVPHHRSAAASRHGHHRSAAVDALLADAGGNAVEELGATSDLQLPAATTAPAAAPASVADQPPLAARENFAFAPYWTLTQSPLFDLTGLSTLDYFAVGVNPNGSLDENGPGWDGFESQDLSDLITRAHEAGERVVLTVNDFDQGSLDTLTTSPTAATTLSSALIPLLQAKSLDGVNFDFEGDGSGDQVGLTSLIEAVSGALRAADPHWQVTMDTYASSAGDSDGFYNIPALAPFVDAFFVMDYELNLAGSPSGASPLTSGAFSSLTTLKQYTSVVPASKVILGLPFFGIDWPTNNGTMAANATGGANDIAESQAQGNGPEYWDPVTGTEWTSYQVGNQWHESYYEGEYGLYEADLMAAYFGARGVGIWALGMESDGAQLIAALDGISPGGPGSTGPAATSSSPGAAPAPAPAPA